MAELSPLRGKFGHHDLISLNEDYPLLYRDTCCGLPGLVPPYCALLKYIGFIDLDLIVFQCFMCIGIFVLVNDLYIGDPLEAN